MQAPKFPLKEGKDMVRGAWGCRYYKVRIVGEKSNVRMPKGRTSEGTGTVMRETSYVSGISNNVRSKNPKERLTAHRKHLNNTKDNV